MKFVIEHLEKHFDKKVVLKNINFIFEESKIYGLLGRNGAGKTTLFNCINRDIKADGGTFYLEEDGIRHEVKPENIGYVLSTPTVPEFLTGREFLKFFLDINGNSVRNAKGIDEYFDYMSIEPEDRDKLMKDYSHGMKNKMQMLVNIIAEPKILLLDEPLSALDGVIKESIKDKIKEIAREYHLTTIIVTHDPEEALTLSGKVVIMNQGTIAQYGRPEDIINTPEEDFVKNFILRQLEIKRNNIMMLFSESEAKRFQVV